MASVRPSMYVVPGQGLTHAASDLRIVLEPGMRVWPRLEDEEILKVPTDEDQRIILPFRNEDGTLGIEMALALRGPVEDMLCASEQIFFDMNTKKYSIGVNTLYSSKPITKQLNALKSKDGKPRGKALGEVAHDAAEVVKERFRSDVPGVDVAVEDLVILALVPVVKYKSKFECVLGLRPGSHDSVIFLQPWSTLYPSLFVARDAVSGHELSGSSHTSASSTTSCESANALEQEFARARVYNRSDVHALISRQIVLAPTSHQPTSCGQGAATATTSIGDLPLVDPAAISPTVPSIPLLDPCFYDNSSYLPEMATFAGTEASSSCVDDPIPQDFHHSFHPHAPMLDVEHTQAEPFGFDPMHDWNYIQDHNDFVDSVAAEHNVSPPQAVDDSGADVHAILNASNEYNEVSAGVPYRSSTSADTFHQNTPQEFYNQISTNNYYSSGH